MARGSRSHTKLRIPVVIVCSVGFFLWLFMGGLLLLRRPCTPEERRGIRWLLCGTQPPLAVYAAYDIVLAMLGVLMRALASFRELMGTPRRLAHALSSRAQSS